MNYGYAQIGHGGANANFGNITNASITLSGSGNAAINGGGTNTHAMIGHGGHTATGTVTTSSISLDMFGGITLQGGLSAADSAGAQIGHGGHNAHNLQVIDSNILINQATGTGTGDVVVSGGGVNSYAMIGHGGSRTDVTIGTGNDSVSGNIDIARAANVRVVGGNNTDGVAQIGHGGERSPGTHSGSITVKTSGEVAVRGGTAGNYAIAMIGHGGVMGRGATSGSLSGTRSGTITLEAGGAISLKGGSSTGASAQVGHGGFQSTGNTSGSIIVRSGGKISLLGGSATDSFAMIGLGGSQANGNHGLATDQIIVIGDGGISLDAGSTNVVGLAAQIGNGGYNATGAGDVTGGIYLNYDPSLPVGNREVGGGDITVKATTGGNGSYAQVGHGGRANNGTKTGEIIIGRVDHLLVQGGSGGSNTNAQIGHGGFDDNNGSFDGDIQGSIQVTQAKNITVQGGGESAHAMIGHGGWFYDGTISNSLIDLSFTGQMKLTGGGGTFAGAQIGHGSPNSINLVVVNSAIQIKGGGSGNIELLGAGSNAYAQIGHGGARSDANPNFVNKSGAISITDVQNLTMTGGTTIDAYAQIGHGGEGGTSGGNAALASGEIDVQLSGDLLMQGGKNTDTYAQIGHGGESTRLSAEDKITITVDGSVTLNGGDTVGTSNYAQIGHGGAKSVGTRSGAIELSADGAVSLTGGTMAMSYAKVGHGGSGTQGAMSGAITVSGDNVHLNGAAGVDASAQIGHGGTALAQGATVADADILVNSINGIDLLAGVGSNTYTQIGHGGFESRYLTVTNSDIRINEAAGTGNGDITMKAGSKDPNTYAMIGHGGSRSDVNVGGDISAEGDILIDHVRNILIEGGAGTDNFSQIGHGGERGQGLYQGDIRINASGDLSILGGGSLTRTFARVGHGGHSGGAAKIGDLWIQTGGNIQLQSGGGSTQNFVQIGHGGVDEVGNTSGALHIVSGGDLDILGGSDISNYALVGHGGTTTAGVPTAGIREGDVLIQVEGNTYLSDEGAYAYLTHRGNSGVSGDSRFMLVSGTIDAENSVQGVGGMIGNMLRTGSVEIGVRNGDLLVTGSTADVVSNHHIDLFASENVILRTLVLSGGASGIVLLGGWDGTSGWEREIVPLGEPLIQKYALDASSAVWGQNGGSVFVGDGNQMKGAAAGSAKGTTTVLGHAVNVIGSTINTNAFAQIGFQPRPGVSPTGDIVVSALEGGVTVAGGSFLNTYAQIGHRNLGMMVPDMAGDIVLTSDGGLTMTGGSSLQTYAQVGHGGSVADSHTISGHVQIDIADDIVMTGGTAAVSSTQIGHGGYKNNADMLGELDIRAGGDITLAVQSSINEVYVKIGHGDDMRYGAVADASTGDRSGDIAVTAGSNISVIGGLIGHANDQSPASLSSGGTWIAPARNTPDDPMAGSLIGDANAAFSGKDGVRFYLPRRENNQLSAGAKINGVVYDGGVDDPWYEQRPDEYANYIVTDSGILHPGEHDNTLGSGPAPIVAGNYAFYFDTIVVSGEPPVIPPVTPPVTPPVIPPVIPPVTPPEKPFSWSDYFADDRALEEWIRSQEDQYRGPGSTNIYYEGFSQYGPNGESTYRYGFSDAPSLSSDEEEVLRRHLRHLEGNQSKKAEDAAVSGGGEE